MNDLGDEERAALAVEGPMSAETLAELPVPEQYIVSKLHELVESCTEGLEAYNMADAGFDIYQFLWNEYADWFIEVSKTRFEAGGGDDPEAVSSFAYPPIARFVHTRHTANKQTDKLRRRA